VTTLAGIRVAKVRVPFVRPFATSTGMWFAREAWIVRLSAADGREGVGEAVLDPADGQAASSVLDWLAEGLSAAEVNEWPEAPRSLEEHGSPGRALRAALDTAWLDLGVPVGGVTPWSASAPGPRAAVGVNATLPLLDPHALAEAAAQAVGVGFRTLKLKAGAERETDVLTDRIRALRSAVGPEIRLRLDVNGAWDLETATERLEALERFGLEYVEQPLSGEDPAALAELRRRVDIPVAADESVTSLRAVRQLLDADAVDVLVVKPVRVGGPIVTAEIAALAATRGVPVVVSTLFETGVGIAAGVAVAAALPPVPGGRFAWPPDHGLATAGLLEHDLLTDGLVLDGGRLWTPGEPGSGRLGIRLNPAAVARYSSDRAQASNWEAWDA